MSDRTDTAAALSEMLNGDTENTTDEVAYNATNETSEVVEQGGATDSVNNDTDDAEVSDTFPREYVENLRSEAARYRTEAKEVKERFSAQTERLTEVEGNAAKAELDVVRWKVAARHGISEEDVNLFLTASDEETLTKQAERLSQPSLKTPRPDAAQGNRSNTGPLSTKQQGAAALGSLFN